MLNSVTRGPPSSMMGKHSFLSTYGVSMLKKALTVLGVSAAGLLMFAPSAGAQPTNDNPFGPWDYTDKFVSAFDPAAYGSQGDRSIIISPFGTSQTIECNSFHGQSWCNQYDPSGAKHGLTLLTPQTGSTAGARQVYIYNPL
ncbi:hypothetical protein QMK17_17210 [Rhodococcus sp. G-MC3]|uniref:hypothetical protein n=1 Tax=Rhodococcus sp. G-MC3 TaxID=3046209 RepID=UPI0024B90BFC|nr:hypothetical protein [Rhodococcus sp. G-MC3]MDJ0395066.1 hypothetical protein [Rhodococcus sp. G-MC3]